MHTFTVVQRREQIPGICVPLPRKGHRPTRSQGGGIPGIRAPSNQEWPPSPDRSLPMFQAQSRPTPTPPVRSGRSNDASLSFEPAVTRALVTRRHPRSAAYRCERMHKEEWRSKPYETLSTNAYGRTQDSPDTHVLLGMQLQQPLNVYRYLIPRARKLFCGTHICISGNPSTGCKLYAPP